MRYVYAYNKIVLKACKERFVTDSYAAELHEIYGGVCVHLP